MVQNNYLRNLGICALGVLLCGITATASNFDNKPNKRPEKPNIIYIMADDLGKEWLSCYGAEKIETPSIDRLANKGIKFTNFYCMPQCTPTRLSFLTGQYPCNHGWINHWDVPRWGGGCHFDTGILPSIGNVMRSAGYETAVAGKWQISDFRVEPEACLKAGFKEYCMWTGAEGGNIEKSSKRYWNPYIHTKNGSRTYEDQFGPDIYTNFLLDFMKKNKDKPMFIYYAMCLPHGPLTTTPLKPNVKTKEEKYIAMVEYIDYLIGKIVKQLDKLNIRDNSIIIWTTDNGSSHEIVGLRNGREVHGAKGTKKEENINVPFIINGPELVPEGIVSNALTDVTDMLPTCAELASAKLPMKYKSDGVSIANVILGEADDSKRKWIMAMGGENRANLSDQGVENEWYWRDRIIRNKRYKLFVDPYKNPIKLIDLKHSSAEIHNLIESNDMKIQEIKKELYEVIYQFPEKDNDFKYRSNPAQPWDVEVTVKSEVWKKGRPYKK